MEKIENLGQIAFRSIVRANKPDCLMVKHGAAYTGISATRVKETVEAIAAKLIDFGVRPGDKVAILSENRPEWAMVDLAILAVGAITVPIYSTLPAKQVQYILHDSESVLIFISNALHLKKILEIRAEIPNLKEIIIMERTGDVPQNIPLLSEVIQQGSLLLKESPQIVQQRLASINPKDVCTIVYTSGTTGEPKGVMLTHHNIITNIESLNHAGFNFSPSDCSLSFLPLSHIFERTVGYYALLYFGCTIAYAESLDKMTQNLVEVRPTILIGVPRVFEKFYAKIMEGIHAQTGLKRKLANWALGVATEYTENRLSDKAPSVFLSSKYFLADKLIFGKIRSRLGGRVRIIGSGGAALPTRLAHFFHGVGLTILEGYGLTETSPIISFNRPGSFKFGTVGQPIPGVEIKIAQDDGEILVRGPNVMKGYYKKPEDTAQTITPDGWFHTGDIGEIDESDNLKITDRKKDLIVTSAGKNIAPQFVENTVKVSPYVHQIVVLGDKRKYPCALIVPNLQNLKKYATAHQISENDLVRNPDIIQEVQRDIDRLSADLAQFERIKRIALLENEFSIESGELTPSLKVKRNVVEKRYKDIIDNLYSEPVFT
jgi:long-chain acyl-CoA synthetase